MFRWALGPVSCQEARKGGLFPVRPPKIGETSPGPQALPPRLGFQVCPGHHRAPWALSPCGRRGNRARWPSPGSRQSPWGPGRQFGTRPLGTRFFPALGRVLTGPGPNYLPLVGRNFGSPKEGGIPLDPWVTVYSLGGADSDSLSLGERLRADPAWNRSRALAALIFIMFYAPCFVTLAVIAREAGSWRWAMFSMAFNTVIAYVLATAVFARIGCALGLG